MMRSGPSFHALITKPERACHDVIGDQIRSIRSRRVFQVSLNALLQRAYKALVEYLSGIACVMARIISERQPSATRRAAARCSEPTSWRRDSTLDQEGESGRIPIAKAASPGPGEWHSSTLLRLRKGMHLDRNERRLQGLDTSVMLVVQTATSPAGATRPPILGN